MRGSIHSLHVVTLLYLIARRGCNVSILLEQLHLLLDLLLRSRASVEKYGLVRLILACTVAAHDLRRLSHLLRHYVPEHARRRRVSAASLVFYVAR